MLLRTAVPPRRSRAKAAGVAVLIAAAAAAVSGQSDNSQQAALESGRAALAAHDPTSAITHFEKVDTRQGREWLAVSLMMESRSPSDAFVERAYDAAQRSRLRAGAPVQPRESIAGALHPGDMVIAFLIGESHAYAWAFDRDVFVGYPLPPPAELTPAISRARAYIDAKDRQGLKRITDDLVPALLGPVSARLPQLQRVILVLDGPLLGLPVAELNISDVVETRAADYSSLSDVVRSARSAPANRFPAVALGAGIAIAVLLASVVVLLRRKKKSVP